MSLPHRGTWRPHLVRLFLFRPGFAFVFSTTFSFLISGTPEFFVKRVESRFSFPTEVAFLFFSKDVTPFSQHLIRFPVTGVGLRPVEDRPPFFPPFFYCCAERSVGRLVNRPGFSRAFFFSPPRPLGVIFFERGMRRSSRGTVDVSRDLCLFSKRPLPPLLAGYHLFSPVSIKRPPFLLKLNRDTRGFRTFFSPPRRKCDSFLSF